MTVADAPAADRAANNLMPRRMLRAQLVRSQQNRFQALAAEEAEAVAAVQCAKCATKDEFQDRLQRSLLEPRRVYIVVEGQPTLPPPATPRGELEVAPQLLEAIEAAIARRLRALEEGVLRGLGAADAAGCFAAIGAASGVSLAGATCGGARAGDATVDGRDRSSRAVHATVCGPSLGADDDAGAGPSEGGESSFLRPPVAPGLIWIALGGFQVHVTVRAPGAVTCGAIVFSPPILTSTAAAARARGRAPPSSRATCRGARARRACYAGLVLRAAGPERGMRLWTAELAAPAQCMPPYAVPRSEPMMMRGRARVKVVKAPF